MTDVETETRVVGELIVNPGQRKSFLVGLYENVLTEPGLSLDVKPDIGGNLSARLERSDDSDMYCLVYNFYNSGSRSCRVKISESVE